MLKNVPTLRSHVNENPPLSQNSFQSVGLLKKQVITQT